jgi:dienelactone hydrolase
MTNQISPDLFTFADGTPVITIDDWQRRRKEIRDIIVNIEYGGMPPTPEYTLYEELHTASVAALPDTRFMTVRVITGNKQQFSFIMTLLIPPGDGPFPVVLNGDGCWKYANDEVTAEIIRRGYIFAQFNRVEIAPDIYNSNRDTGIYPVYPEGNYGALSAWAWGYHRCVDVLGQMSFANSEQIGITGHSRGGKAVLLAGATDDRIAVASPNNSGCGGAGSYKYQGPESETITDIMRAIPYWFNPDLKDYIGREEDLPFDQHFLKAIIAPRALLTTEALGDLWANPTGTWVTHTAARKAYQFLNAEEKIGIFYREGGHCHGFEDWRIFLDFMDTQIKGINNKIDFNKNPFIDSQ